MKLSVSRKVKKRFMPIFGLKNITIDMCRYLKGIAKSQFMDMIAGNMRKYSNILHPCPFSVSCNFLFHIISLHLIHSFFE